MATFKLRELSSKEKNSDKQYWGKCSFRLSPTCPIFPFRLLTVETIQNGGKDVVKINFITKFTYSASHVRRKKRGEVHRFEESS